MSELIIDGTNALLGRVASFAAKQALLGRQVVIVHCNHVVISGGHRSIVKHYQEKRQRGGAGLKGPFFPGMAERIVKRTIRGMLPYKQARGDDALGRIRCYNEMPLKYAGAKKIVSGKEKKIKTLSLQKLIQEL